MGRPPHALAEATEAATAAVRRMAVTPMHGYEPDVLIFSLIQKQKLRVVNR